MMPDERSGYSYGEKSTWTKRALPVAFLAMIFLSGTMTFALIGALNSLNAEREQSANMSRAMSELEQALAKEIERNEACDTMLDNYQQLVLGYQQASLYNLTNTTYVFSDLTTASVSAPAVMTVSTGSWPFTTSYEYVGTMTHLSLEMTPGKGRILVNTEPLMGEVFQDTAILAKETAERISRKSLDSYDLIFSISAEAEIPSVDGPSAGAAMTLLALSIIEHQEIRSDISLTGTINADGTIGAIGGVEQKAQAAKDAGFTVLFVPEENSQMTVYEEQTTKMWGRTYRRQVPVLVSTEEYIETNIELEIEFVEDMEELWTLATLGC